MRLRYQAQTASGYETRDEEIAGPFYHGGRARLGAGGLITAGRRTNPWGDEGPVSTHVYFTTDIAGAVMYARETGGRLYEVEPTGDAKPSYGGEFKTEHPLRVIREIPRAAWPT